MSVCVCSNFAHCIELKDFPKGIFSRLRYNAKLMGASWKCPTLCFKDLKGKVVGPNHASCLVHCYDKLI